MQNNCKLTKIIWETSGHRLYSSTTTREIDRNLKKVTTKNKTSFPNDPYGNFVSTYLIENIDVEETFNRIDELTKDWKTIYISFNTTDSPSWYLKFFYSNSETKTCYGNVKPPNYDEVINFALYQISLRKTKLPLVFSSPLR